MRTLSITFIFILIFNVYAFAQKPVLKTLWAGNDSLYLSTLEVEGYPTQLIFEKINPKFGNIRKSFTYKVSGDTLKVKNYPESDTGAFIMDTLKKGQLVLTPVNEQASHYMVAATLTSAQKHYKFNNVTALKTDTIKFEKLLFRSTNCYGFCPAITLEIDHNRKVRYIGGKFAVKQGQFEGKLSAQLSAQLINLLKTADLDKLVGNTLHNVDAPDYTIEVHYNHKVLYLNTMEVPFALEPLKAMLLDIPRNVNWTPASAPVTVNFIK